MINKGAIIKNKETENSNILKVNPTDIYNHKLEYYPIKITKDKILIQNETKCMNLIKF